MRRQHFVINYTPTSPYCGITKMTELTLLNLQAIEVELNNDDLFTHVLETFGLTVAQYQLDTTGQSASTQQSVEL